MHTNDRDGRPQETWPDDAQLDAGDRFDSSMDGRSRRDDWRNGKRSTDRRHADEREWAPRGEIPSSDAQGWRGRADAGLHRYAPERQFPHENETWEPRVQVPLGRNQRTDARRWEEFDDEQGDSQVANWNRRTVSSAEDESTATSSEWPPQGQWRSGRSRRANEDGARRTQNSGRRDQRRRGRFFATRRARFITIGVCMLVLFVLLGSGGVALADYQHTLALAKSGVQHLKNAEADLVLVPTHPFDTTNVTRAHDEFRAALQNFVQVSGVLGAVPSMLTGAPVVGSKLGAAGRLMPIAIEGSQAGMIACDAVTILMTKLTNPLSPSTSGLTAGDLSLITAKFTELSALVGQMLSQLSSLRPSDLSLDPRLGPVLATVQAKLPQIPHYMDMAKVILAAAPQLLGVTSPSNILIEVLDSTELRPGGGFIGNYGMLTVTGGHLNGIHVQDVDLLDAPYKYGPLVIPLPAQYQWFAGTSPKWGFRDSNLEADFPTSAQYGESLYKQEGGPGQPQGVIAITPWLVQNALRITGPIAVPEFNQTVTADNMIPLIHEYQLTALDGGPDNVSDPNSGTSLRKRFTGYLFQHFMEAVKAQFSQDSSKLLKLAIASVHSKDIQIFFNASSLEGLLQQNHIASTIEAPTTGDSLMAVDANIVASKINYYLHYTLTDQVTLDGQGNATHQTTLAYVWPNDPSTLTNSFPAGYPYLYIGYLRFYVPPGAQLLAQTGWQSAATPAAAYGRTVWGGVVYLQYASETDITINWREPKAATLSGSTWTYPVLIQRQAGVTVALRYTLNLPSCAKPTNTPPAGATLTNQHTLTLNEPLATDVSLALNYTC